ncbi:hypothetical protein [Nonomuraea sp. NPDC005501]|uniref:hypothetical protein n=1 Tax=Nonomuraea sp. NPDC005501 TaxID=3156884 RepID=UPI0033AA7AF6
MDYRYGHGYALLRGYPEIDDDAPGDSPLRVMDVVFAGASRLSCWKDVGALHLREASGDELADLVARMGRLRAGQRVFLLHDDSLEDYIVSYGVQWAEFDLPGGAQSPLVSEDLEYRRIHQPVNGETFSA